MTSFQHNIRKYCSNKILNMLTFCINQINRMRVVLNNMKPHDAYSTTIDTQTLTLADISHEKME